MKIKVHLPRPTEATVTPKALEEVVIVPKFYKKTGFVPIFYMTTEDSFGNEERYVVQISGTSKFVRTDKLVEVIPDCDEPEHKRRNHKDDEEDIDTSSDTPTTE